MSAHTSGPWSTRSAVSGPDRDIGIVAPGCDNVIAECYEEFRARGVREPDEARANARLIASAPDLLEACKLALAETERASLHFKSVSPVTVILRAAIAKAETP